MASESPCVHANPLAMHLAILKVRENPLTAVKEGVTTVRITERPTFSPHGKQRHKEDRQDAAVTHRTQRAEPSCIALGHNVPSLLAR